MRARLFYVLKYRSPFAAQVAGFGRGTICQASWVLVLAIACVISAAAWLYLVVAHGGFWLTSQRLPAATVGAGGSRARTRPELPRPETWPRSPPWSRPGTRRSRCPVTLPALLAQDYPGEFRVFLVDDNSDDGTGAIAAELGEKAARDGGAPLTVVKGQPRPDGWAGKVWAMAQGFAAVTGHGRGRAGSGGDRRPRAGVRAVHRRGHRLGPARAPRPGPRRRSRRPGPRLADGPASRGDQVGAGDRARLRLLLRPALPVPQGQ